MVLTKLADGSYTLVFNDKKEEKSIVAMLTRANSKSLKAGEVMEILGISRVTLCHYVQRGLIEIDSNYTGGQYRYNAASVYKLRDEGAK